jgi:hypothetical protein
VLKPVIGRFMGPGVVLVDSAAALAEAAQRRLAEADLLRAGPTGALQFYLSDIPWKFAEVGARFLGRPIEDVTTVNLDEVEASGGLFAASGSAKPEAPASPSAPNASAVPNIPAVPNEPPAPAASPTPEVAGKRKGSSRE